MKLLIVDDEPRTVKGLLKCLDYASFGIHEIRTASDGLAALETMEHFPADIVLADIGMPKMSGIELSRELCRLYPAVRIAFITGHADVDYMKSAFKAQAADYILKPIDVQELRSVMERITAQISTERQRTAYLREIESRLDESIPLLREKFFLGLLNNDFSDPALIAERLRVLRLSFTPDTGYAVFVIVPDHPAEARPSDGGLLSVAIASNTQEILSAHGGGYCFEKADSHFVCILTLPQLQSLPGDDSLTPTAEELLESIAGEVRQALAENLELSVTIGVAPWCERLTDLPAAYEIAQQAAARRLYLGTNQIILGSSTGIHQAPFVHIPFFHYNRIYTAVVNSNVDEALLVTDEIFRTIGACGTWKRAQVLTVCAQIITAANSALTESIECSDEDAAALTGALARIQSCTTIDEMRSMVEGHIRQSAERILSASLSVPGDIVHTVKTIVNEHYSENISLRTIAKDVYLSPSYLCLLFKQETGQTLTSYITGVRIERAKHLMQNRNKKLIDVCFEVGFNDSKYFSRVFKKYTGKSPSAYQSDM
jgi:two-component system response regulator YesN